jgi:hypothetical protein
MHSAAEGIEVILEQEEQLAGRRWRLARIQREGWKMMSLGILLFVMLGDIYIESWDKQMNLDFEIS